MASRCFDGDYLKSKLWITFFVVFGSKRSFFHMSFDGVIAYSQALNYILCSIWF